jgi:ubiquinone/menaquinone biosynthesis C-methylase UbiE
MARPVIYDFVQNLMGAGILSRHLSRVFPANKKPGIVLDLGGGTGVYRKVWKGVRHYVCLDNDMQKALGFKNKFGSQDTVIVADATKIPFKDRTIDFVQCTMMSHHLNEQQLGLLIKESHRVLKEGGQFIFMDAVLDPGSWKRRFLWSLDRGSYPKSEEMLLSMIDHEFKIKEDRSISIHHLYLFCVGQK